MLKVLGASQTRTNFSIRLISAVSFFCLFLFIFGMTNSKIETDGKYAATAYWTKEFGLRIEYWGQNNDPLSVKQGVARAYYQPDLSENGWSTLEVETQPEFSDHVQARAAGYLEGSLMWHAIHLHWKKTVEKACVGRKKFCSRVRKFLKTNAEKILRKARRLDETDPFWHQVNMFYTQLKALEEGWRFGVKRSLQELDIPSVDFLWMNVMSDLKDIERQWNCSKDLNMAEPSLSTALVKIISVDPIDYVLAQSTYEYHGSMLRVQKRYNLGFHETRNEKSALVNGKIIQFTSYPGSIFSQDDFYKVTKRSFDTETTVVGTEIQNNNCKHWDEIMKLDQVLLGARTVAANRLANNSKEWYEVFSKNNSGTGNKQWLILIANNASIEFGVVEQLPSVVKYEELSKTLMSTGYWVSCSYPRFEAQTRASHPVANVLHDGQRNVTDLASLEALVRAIGPRRTTSRRDRTRPSVTGESRVAATPEPEIARPAHARGFSTTRRPPDHVGVEPSHRRRRPPNGPVVWRDDLARARWAWDVEQTRNRRVLVVFITQPV